jgi:hypothetical protein
MYHEKCMLRYVGQINQIKSKMGVVEVDWVCTLLNNVFADINCSMYFLFLRMCRDWSVQEVLCVVSMACIIGG